MPNKNYSKEECICEKCFRRFTCPNERIFSDPLYQGLFEALLAKGNSRLEAIDIVIEEIKRGLIQFPTQIYPIQPYPIPTYPTYPWIYYNNTLSNCFTDVTYTLSGGEKVYFLY